MTTPETPDVRPVLRCPRDGYALIRGVCPLCEGKVPGPTREFLTAPQWDGVWLVGAA